MGIIFGGWWDLWGEATKWTLPRDVSDHSTVVLRYSSQLWGPKSLRFNNFWLGHQGLGDIVSNCWNRSRPPEWMAVRLSAKLKALKVDLKGWIAQVFGGLDGRIDAQVDVLSLLDPKAEEGSLSHVDMEARFKGFHDLWMLLRVKDSQIFQRSRTKWLREGDANSGHFHSSIKMRRRRNSIFTLRVGNRWVESVPEVHAQIVTYFRDHFSDSMLDRPTLDRVPLPSLSEAEARDLVVPFSEEEIRKVVIKSDGFNFTFYKSFWELLKGEVNIMFHQFFHSATLPRCFSSYFVTLIPKVPSPTRIGDFRPISLLGSL